jgi:V/A-type H+-transporting ATPase subunit A
MRILLEANELAQVVRIMGEEGLPEEQRKVLLADRLIKEAFLQQSAFSVNDRYASPEKQSKLLRLVVRVARQIMEDGDPVDTLASKYRLDELIRLKDEVPSGKAEILDTWDKVHA